MQKRNFLQTAVTAAGVAALPWAAQAQHAPAGARGPTLLTISGAVERTNRGPVDPALDQLMVKHKVNFQRAFAFDFTTLSVVRAVNLRPTLEYDRQPHNLRGPLLMNVLQTAGVRLVPTTRLLLRAIDGYAVQLTISQLQRQHFIVATHIDGQPLALGGLGPLWAVLEADRYPELAAQPLNTRFANCPWGLYHIEVTA